FARDLMRRRMLEVKRQRSLALVVLVEIAGAVEPAGLALRPRRQQAGNARAGAGFNSDDVRPEMRQLEGAIRTRPNPGEIGDSNALQRSRGHQTIPLRFNSASRAALKPRRLPKISSLCCPSVGAGIRSSQGVAAYFSGAPG